MDWDGCAVVLCPQPDVALCSARSSCVRIDLVDIGDSWTDNLCLTGSFYMVFNHGNNSVGIASVTSCAHGLAPTARPAAENGVNLHRLFLGAVCAAIAAQRIGRRRGLRCLRRLGCCMRAC